MKKLYIILAFTFISQIFYGQWTVTNLGVNEYLFSIDHKSPNEIWIGANDGIFKSNNGGASWSLKKSISVGFLGYNSTELFGVKALGFDTAVFIGKILGGNKQQILITNDGGNTWQLGYNNSPLFINSQYNAIDGFANNYKAMGRNCGIASSIDGQSWSVGFYTNGFDVVDFKYATKDTLICITNHRIMHSQSNGGLWLFSITPGTIYDLDNEKFHQITAYKNVSYITSLTNKLFKSINYGQNYAILPLPSVDSNSNLCVKAINADTLFYSDKKGLYISRSGGKYWEKFIIPNYKKLNKIHFIGSNKLVAIGNNGYILQNPQIFNSLRLPKSHFSFPFNANSYYCSGTSINLNNLTDSLAGYTYQWLLNDTLFSTQYHATVTLNSILGNNKIALISSNANGSDTITKSIFVYGHDLKNFILNAPDTACRNSYTDFSISNSQLGVNYQLRKGFTKIGSSKSGNGAKLYFSASIGTTNSETFNIIAIKSNNCFTDSIIQYKTIYTKQSSVQYCNNLLQSNVLINDGILNFTLNTINRNSSFGNNYTDYSCCNSTNLVLKNNYNYSITRRDSNYPAFFKIWIDFNNNLVFDVNEKIVDTTFANNLLLTGNLRIPDSANVFYSTLRMRVAMSESIYGLPCNSFGYGAEYEDYSVSILPSPTKPKANFIYTLETKCSTTFKFKEKAINATSFAWDFGDGNTSILRNPIHTYGTTLGNYIVKLVSCNPYFCDTVSYTVFNTVPKIPVSSCTPILVNVCGNSNPSVGDINSYGYPQSNLHMQSNDYTCIRQYNFYKDSLNIIYIFKNLNGGYYAANLDFNNNGIFEANERLLGSGLGYIQGGNYNLPITIDLGNSGIDSIPLRLRVTASCNYASNTCGQFTGSYKDITIFLIPHVLTPSDFYTPTTGACGVTSASFTFYNKTKGVKYSYWDFGDGDTSTQFSPVHTYANPGTYTVKLKTCNDTQCDSITKTNYITISSIPFTTAVNAPDTVYLCGSNPVVISTKYYPGHTYQWKSSSGAFPIPLATDTSYTITTHDYYNVWVTNPIGCLYQTNVISALPTYTSCVWPGDVNNDLVVDQNDLLPIGVLYGANGYARSRVSNLWYGYPGDDWQPSSLLLSNDRFADCNGDGIVSLNDTMAVHQNFNSTHLNKMPALAFQSSVNPDVSVKFNKVTYQNGDTVIADVHIGSALNPQNNFYGASFKLNYNPNYAVPGSVKFTFNDSWIGKLNKRFIKFSKIREALGLVDLSIVRISQTDTSGYGKIGTLKFVVSNTMPNGKMIFNIMNANKIDHFGINFTPLAGGSDSVNVVQTSSLERTSSINHIIIRPNPSDGEFEISSNTLLKEVCISNLLGEIIFRKYINSSFELIDISSRPQGVYILKINGSFYRIIKD